MILPTFIAKRYLFAKKSHNVINIISLISAGGIALGTMALIIILSVYNGFEDLIKSLYNTHDSDLLIVPSVKKSFDPTSEGFDQIRNSDKVARFCEVVEENIFVKYAEQEAVATIKGVDSNYQAITKLGHYITDGEFSLKYGEVPQAIIGSGLARNLGVNIHFMDALNLYFPSRYRPISLVNPTSSLNTEKVFPAGIFSIEQGFDNKYIYIPIDVARNLVEYDNEVTSVELYLKNGSDVQELKETFGKAIGKDFRIKDRYEQNETLYKMMGSEKASIYIILLFIIIIISCNLFGSLSMLIIEKKEDMESLKSMGASDSLIKQIFLLEGWFISIIGIIVGTILGLVICFLQIRYGIVEMPGNFIIKYYPVVIKWTDVLITMAGVGAIGYVAAKLPFLVLRKVENF